MILQENFTTKINTLMLAKTFMYVMVLQWQIKVIHSLLNTQKQQIFKTSSYFLSGGV